MNTLLVSYITFKRTEDSPEEAGVMFNEHKLIVDADAKVVPTPIYNYWANPWRGTLLVDVTPPAERKS